MSLQKLLEACNYETMSYSGRGMYGEKCLAIDFDGNNVMKVAVDCFEAFMQFGENAEEEFGLTQEELCKAFRRVSYDQLGMGMVVYFPSIDYEDGEYEDE